MLDLSETHRKAFNAAVPYAGQGADPFHVVRLANNTLNDVCRALDDA